MRLSSPLPRIVLSLYFLSLAASVGTSADPEPKPAVAQDDNLGPLVGLLTTVDDAQFQLDLLQGMHLALNGRRNIPMPAGWEAAYPKLKASAEPRVREVSRALAVLFGDKSALAEVRATLVDAKAAPEARQAALAVLLQRRPEDLVRLLQALLDDTAMRGAAIRGLAAYADPQTPALVLKHYAKLNDAERDDAVNTLASRPEYARALLAAMEAGTVKRGEVSAFTARQIVAFQDPDLTAKLNVVWGEIRPASAERVALSAKYKQLLTPDALQNADRSAGRKVFSKSCAACHKLFDDGGKIGPELTGAQRANLDYVLENLLDPSAVVGRDYQVLKVVTVDGRTINGIVRQENDNAVILQTPNDLVTVPLSEIEERVRSTVSMMPEGLLSRMTDDEVRQLVAYLASPGQVPLP